MSHNMHPTLRHRLEFRLYRALDCLRSACPWTMVQSVGVGLETMALLTARTWDLHPDAWIATQAMVGCIEDQVRKDPRWWFWMHRRFKTQPRDGHPVPPPEWIESYSAAFPPQALSEPG